MAVTTQYNISVSLFFIPFLLIFSCFPDKLHVYGAGNDHDLETDAFLVPKLTCSAPPRGRQSHGLQVTHRYGPCSPLHQDRTSLNSHEFFLKDQARVQGINAQMTNQYPTDESDPPSKSKLSLGAGNFLVTVGLGTPKLEFTLIFDTGSDIPWMQCKPCSSDGCYSQQEPMFDPSKSSTYSNGSCIPYTENSYSISYKDGSSSSGQYGCDTLVLEPADVIPKFQFGCGRRNKGDFGGAAGMLGLGRGKTSLLSQIDSTFGKVFSYCLPPIGSSTGHLLFGKRAQGIASGSLKFTPLIINPSMPSFYFVKLIGISVANKRLNVSASIFGSYGAVLDSGTVITRLPSSAYSQLRSAFRNSMSMYPTAPPLPPLLDTCYNLNGYKVMIPMVVLHFDGGADVSLDPSGVVWRQSVSQVCLAFAPNKYGSDQTIIGNNQQKTLEVLYDLKVGRIGFGTNGCN